MALLAMPKPRQNDKMHSCAQTNGQKPCVCHIPQVLVDAIPRCRCKHRSQPRTSLCRVCFPENLQIILGGLTTMGPMTIKNLNKKILEKPRSRHYIHRRLVTSLENIDEEPDSEPTDLRVLSRSYGQRTKEEVLAKGKTPTRVRRTRAKVYYSHVQDDTPKDATNTTTSEEAEEPKEVLDSVIDVDQLVDLMAKLTITAVMLHRLEPPQLSLLSCGSNVISRSAPQMVPDWDEMDLIG